jgi:predicted aldo/keto reductase-like oxidoreductase
MRYVPFGKTGLEVSRLGLGAMRFPEDRKEAVRMVHAALDAGINYIDSAYVYVNSEEVIGEALAGSAGSNSGIGGGATGGGSRRSEVYLATKSPSWLIERPEDYERFIDEELTRLRTDYIDLYLLHNIFPRHWEKSKRFGALEFLDKMKAKGKIRYTGFSLHDTRAAFEEIANAYDWDCAMVQMNILDPEHQVGVEGLRWGAERMAMVVMEPLRGGFILRNKPPEVDTILASYPEQRSLTDWCFRWLYDMPEVATILSGPSTMEQLEDNLRIFAEERTGVMSTSDQALIARVRAAYEGMNVVACTACGYCMPCPSDVDIPEIFRIYNSYTRHGKHLNDGIFYRERFVPSGIGANQCVACGVCERHCPQGLPIIKCLAEAHAEMGERHVGDDRVRVDMVSGRIPAPSEADG